MMWPVHYCHAACALPCARADGTGTCPHTPMVCTAFGHAVAHAARGIAWVLTCAWVHRCARTPNGASVPSRTCRLCVIAFLWGFLQYEAKGRISAEAALRHAYFKSLGERVHLLPDSKCALSSCRGDVEQRGAVHPEGGGLQPGLFRCLLSWLAQSCSCGSVGWEPGGCESEEQFGKDSVGQERERNALVRCSAAVGHCHRSRLRCCRALPAPPAGLTPLSLPPLPRCLHLLPEGDPASEGPWLPSLSLSAVR